MGDLNKRKGTIQGSDQEGEDAVLTAHVPLASMFGYSTDLRSMTQVHTRSCSFCTVVPQISLCAPAIQEPHCALGTRTCSTNLAAQLIGHSSLQRSGQRCRRQNGPLSVVTGGASELQSPTCAGQGRVHDGVRAPLAGGRPDAEGADRQPRAWHRLEVSSSWQLHARQLGP